MIGPAREYLRADLLVELDQHIDELTAQFSVRLDALSPEAVDARQQFQALLEDIAAIPDAWRWGLANDVTERLKDKIRHLDRVVALVDERRVMNEWARRARVTR